MEIIPGADLEDSLLSAFVGAGRRGHEIAAAHHNDPGSNGFTFGVDRYHRSCELLKDDLEAHDFAVWNKGAGLRAARGELELHFATAKTANVEAPFSFDRMTDSRVDAARFNSAQPPLDGLDHEDLPGRQILHVVWSGDPAEGLVAVHVGRLVEERAEFVSWEVVRRIDRAGEFTPADVIVVEGSTTYVEQPIPELGLEAVAPSVSEALDAEQR